MNGVAFELPEGFCYNSNPENGIEFISEDECEEKYLMFSLRINDHAGDIMDYVETEEFKRLFYGITKADE